jgi:hypothetical protein
MKNKYHQKIAFESKSKAICIILRNPSETWFDFLNEFKFYDKYVVIDDNSEDYKERYRIKYPTINIIQIDEHNCESRGFRNLNHYFTQKTVTGWEKALFYFSCINQEYQFTWFFEDDIFFHNENTLKNIDMKYPEGDLLSRPFKSTKTDKKWIMWDTIDIEYSLPYYNTMVCGIRVSKELLYHINEYASKYYTLFFLEILFPTVVVKNNLKQYAPKELIQIYFRHKWNIYTVSKKNIFHPVKDHGFHIKARKRLDKKSTSINLLFQIANLYTRSYRNSKYLKSIIEGRFIKKLQE